jgi:hypothetical protein
LFFVDYRKNGCLTSFFADNWDLDEFFESLICGRWYIHLEQTIYHLFRPIIIFSGWLWSPVVEYQLQWLIVISRINHHRWYSSLLNEYRPRQMSIICFSWILSALDEYHPRQMSIICFSWISSAGDEYHATYLIIVHNRWYSTARDDNQQLIGRHRWYIVCSR